LIFVRSIRQNILIVGRKRRDQKYILILSKLSISAGTIEGCKLLQVTYKENTAGNLSILLDLADDIEAGGEVKKIL
jgi:hypothetical protein